MKKVLKILCIVMVIVLGVSLVACSKSDNQSSVEETQPTNDFEISDTTKENVSVDQDDYYAPETTETHYFSLLLRRFVCYSDFKNTRA